MIGWERRVLLRHYLEQGMTKTELAERFGTAVRRFIAGSAVESWTEI